MSNAAQLIENLIESQEYVEVVPGKTVVAIIVMKNGHVVIGESHLAPGGTHDEEKAVLAAKADAFRKIAPMVMFHISQSQYDARRLAEHIGDGPTPESLIQSQVNAAQQREAENRNAPTEAPRIATMPQEASRLILPPGAQ